MPAVWVLLKLEYYWRLSSARLSGLSECISTLKQNINLRLLASSSFGTECLWASPPLPSFWVLKEQKKIPFLHRLIRINSLLPSLWVLGINSMQYLFFPSFLASCLQSCLSFFKCISALYRFADSELIFVCYSKREAKQSRFIHSLALND